jgi:hypothetical protein
MFNPINSNWILRNDVWGYDDQSFSWKELPRRVSIVTHVRVSRKMLEVMHVENMRGNQLYTEMEAPTVALLHGLKAVYAPMPIFFDLGWSADRLDRWFNPGPKGTSGGKGCAMGWGEEARFLGSTWYYRATPPQRMYNNWMGYEDTNIGGAEWESIHGRTCLPQMFLHPIKDAKPTKPGSSTQGVLPYR